MVKGRDQLLKEKRQRERQKEKNQRHKRTIIMSTTIFILLVVVVVGIVMVQANKNQASPPTKTSTAPPPQSTQAVPSNTIDISGQPTLGQANAPVSIVEFGDYRCIYCKQLEETIFPKLKKDYIDTGKAKFTFINFTILGPGSSLAANASEIIYHDYPNYFWEFHSTLYHNQGNENKKWVTKSLLTKIAKKTVPNLNVQKFKDELNKETYNNNVLKDHELAVNLKLTGTPDLYVNGKAIADPLNYQLIKAAIDNALNKAGN